MVFYTNTKINIGLFVTNKREDGFHDIESVFYPVSFGDVLEIIPVSGNGNVDFTSYGVTIPGDDDDNLCVKAYNLLSKDFELPAVKSSLLKNVPIGAGLGGGSSDGVTMLKGLNQLFDLNISSEGIRKYALELGCDCPFFVDNDPKFVSGRGELLQDVNLELSGKYIVMVFPDFHVSTVKAFNLIKPKAPSFDLKTIENLPINEWTDAITNDFEGPIANAHPIINEIKQKLKVSGAVYFSMSGSGSTVYGVFDSEPLNLSFEYDYWCGKL